MHTCIAGRSGHAGRAGADFLAQKAPGEVDTLEVLDLKRVIRESEAVSGIETLGMSRHDARFLNLPFYRTGKVKKDPIGPADVAIVRELLEEIRPDLVLVAGDLSDPHGTHRLCKDAIEAALDEVKPAASALKSGSIAGRGRNGR
jgi:glucosamine-6-phosphate deaminase